MIWESDEKENQQFSATSNASISANDASQSPPNKQVGKTRSCSQCGIQVEHQFCPKCGYDMGLPPGTKLENRYVTLDLLGKGSFGATYSVQDLRFEGEIRVAKSLLYTRVEDQAARRLFEEEAQLLSRLHHPGIPRVIDFFESDGTFFLIQDFIRGEPLDRVLKRNGPISQQQVLSIMEQVLELLIYLHEDARREHDLPGPVIHRDIKPSNIMIRPDGRVWLIDFGAVKLARRTKLGSSSTQIYTPGFAAPEQVVGGNVTPTADLFALGVSAIVLLSGADPARYRQDSKWIGIRATLSPAFQQLLDAMIQENASLRPQSAREALIQLKQANLATSNIPLELPPHSQQMLQTGANGSSGRKIIKGGTLGTAFGAIDIPSVSATRVPSSVSSESSCPLSDIWRSNPSVTNSASEPKKSEIAGEAKNNPLGPAFD